MSDVTTLNGVKMVSLEYRAKLGNGANKANFLSCFWQQTVSPHYQLSQQIRNDIMQMVQDLHQSLSTAASL